VKKGGNFFRGGGNKEKRKNKAGEKNHIEMRGKCVAGGKGEKIGAASGNGW